MAEESGWLEEEENWLEETEAEDVLAADNPYLSDPDKGLDLITSLIAPEDNIHPVEEELNELRVMIEERYMEFASKVSLTNESEMFDKLLKGFNRLEEIVKFPKLYNKQIIAIGGAFSAGKSQFINSILNMDFLPTDTTPTTSVPTFLVSGQNDVIEAFNSYGNKVNIDRPALQAISHAFNNKYDINFAHVLKYINASTEQLDYENIAFLDTPGYSKAEDQQESGQDDFTDKSIAREYLKFADWVFWLVDCERGGLMEDDLRFIKELKSDTPILFVVNKADKMPDSKVEKITAAIREEVEENDINYSKVVAYSSIFPEEFPEVGIKKYLNELDKTTVDMELWEPFQEVFSTYQKFHRQEKEKAKKRLETYNNLLADAAKSGQISSEIKSLVDEEKDRIKNEKQILDELAALRKGFRDKVEDIKSGIANKIKVTNRLESISSELQISLEALIGEINDSIPTAKEVVTEVVNQYSALEATSEVEEYEVECPNKKWWHFLSPDKCPREDHYLLTKSELILEVSRELKESIIKELSEISEKLQDKELEVTDSLREKQVNGDLFQLTQFIAEINESLSNVSFEIEERLNSFLSDLEELIDTGTDYTDQEIIELQAEYSQMVASLEADLKEQVETDLEAKAKELADKKQDFIDSLT